MLSKLKRFGEAKMERRKLYEEKRAEEDEFRKAIEGKLGEQFFEREAEVGSDNEENDHVVKRINKADNEENEEGLDYDVEDLLDRSFDENNEEYDQGAADKLFLEEMLKESDGLLGLFNQRVARFRKEEMLVEQEEKDRQQKWTKLQQLFSKMADQSRSIFY